MPKPDLLIVGGSARAAAWCAVRAGMTVAALDRYNDLDLLAVADPCFKWDGSDRQVEEVVGALGVPWMYVGPLENRPDLVDRCAKLAPLRGNGGDVLRAVRDPVRLQRALGEAGLPTLAVREETNPPPADGTWLLKPRGGCGGRGIAVWDRRAAGHATLREPHYFQERDGFRPPYVLIEIDGIHAESAAAVRVDRRVRPLGHSAYLDSPVENDIEDFALREVSGWNVPVTPRFFRSQLEVIAEAFGLVGPFGIDFAATIGRGDDPLDSPRVVEVNPRFTSTMELLGNPFGGKTSPHIYAGKRIVYAPFDCRTPSLPVRRDHFEYGLADVPAAGTAVGRGEPICSVLGFTGRDESPTDTARCTAAHAAEVVASLRPT